MFSNFVRKYLFIPSAIKQHISEHQAECTEMNARVRLENASTDLFNSFLNYNDTCISTPFL